MKHTLIFVVLAVLFNVLFGIPLTEDHLADSDGFFEGDMILNEDQGNHLLRRRPRNAIIDTRYRWPNKTVFYELSSKFNADQKKLIVTSLSVLAKYTCVKYIPRPQGTQHYVYVSGDLKGCWADVGYKRQRQKLNLNYDTCLGAGTIIHEFMHALGFYHMHSAADRDSYVTIINKNIELSLRDNFRKYNNTYVTNFGLPYDYNSVMHYGRKQGSINGKDTIVPHNRTADIGNKDRPSYSDYRKINIMYDCDCDNQ